MPANRNALIRYRAIDNCLTNRYRQWTLDALIAAVSETLYEYEGMEKGISRRTIQADLQVMRSDKLGYNAPIVVIDKKYYAYADPSYSITQIPLTAQDLGRMSEAVEVLKQFKGFSHFEQLRGMVQKLEAHVYAAGANRQPVIDFEKNDELRGLSFLETLYQAIIQQKALLMTYQSFRARQASQFVFHGWWLKEFRNRWFAVGLRSGHPNVQHFALDRILAIDATPDAYQASETQTPGAYYQHVVGVTVSPAMQAERVLIRVSTEHAPYVETKPFHQSQRTVERHADHILIELTVQLNFELERDILGFGEGMTVLAPARLRGRVRHRIKRSIDGYDRPPDT